MFWFQIFVTFKIGDRPRHFENPNNLPLSEHAATIVQNVALHRNVADR